METPRKPHYDPNFDTDEDWYATEWDRGATLDGAGTNDDGTINSPQTGCDTLNYGENTGYEDQDDEWYDWTDEFDGWLDDCIDP